jgi:hypothetical protein
MRYFEDSPGSGFDFEWLIFHDQLFNQKTRPFEFEPAATSHERFDLAKRRWRWEWPTFRFIEFDPLVHGFA